MHNVRYLRVIVTEQCNLNCFFCHREGIKNVATTLTSEELTACIDVLIHCGIMKIKFLGGEPTLRHGLDSLIRHIKTRNPLIDVSMITIGPKLFIFNSLPEKENRYEKVER